MDLKKYGWKSAYFFKKQKRKKTDVRRILRKLTFNDVRNICIVMLIFRKVHFLDLGELSNDLVVQLNN